MLFFISLYHSLQGLGQRPKVFIQSTKVLHQRRSFFPPFHQMPVAAYHERKQKKESEMISVYYRSNHSGYYYGGYGNGMQRSNGCQHVEKTQRTNPSSCNPSCCTACGGNGTAYGYAMPPWCYPFAQYGECPCYYIIVVQGTPTEGIACMNGMPMPMPMDMMARNGMQATEKNTNIQPKSGNQGEQ